MTLRSFKSAAALAVIALPAITFAQTQTSANEDERLEALIRESETVYVPKSTVTVGFRMLSSGAKASFGNLGVVPYTNTVAPASDGNVDRIYNNGTVYKDGLRADEVDEDGNQTSTPGGRYQVSSTTTTTDPDTGVSTDTTTVTGDYLSYTAGLTRTWSYGSEAQALARPGYIAMSTYSASSNGGIASKESGASAGVEVSFERALTKPGRRFQLSLVGGISINDINNKVSGSVTSTLHTLTDYYNLNGAAAPISSTVDTPYPYSAPSTVVVTRDDGTTYTNETTVPLGQIPEGPTVESTGTTIVNGRWQIKGNYFMVRLGPSVTMQMTERFALNASLGYAGAYVGTSYLATESFEAPDGLGVISTADPEKSTISKFLSGYYADLNLLFTANERTGFYGGVLAQKFGDYDQTLNGRTATIDIGSSVGFRGGMSIKF